MKNILGNGRKLLRKLFLFLGVAAISLVFQACYGSPPDDYCTGEEDCDCYNCWQEKNKHTEEDTETASIK